MLGNESKNTNVYGICMMNSRFRMNFLSLCVLIMLVPSLKILRKVEGVFQVQKLDFKKESQACVTVSSI